NMTLSTAQPPPRPTAAAPNGRPRIVVSRSRPPAEATTIAEALGGDLVELGSAGAKAMAVVLGDAEVYAHAGGQYEWDSCAPVAAPPPIREQERRVRQLRIMRQRATGLLLLTAIAFVIIVLVGNDKGAWGYAQAALEASMVGGVADWFAVTALFRHPLGLPIP